MDHLAVVVQMAHKTGDAAFKIKGLLLIFIDIGDGYFQPFIEVSHLPDTFAEGIEIILHSAEDFFIRQKAGGRAGAFRLTGHSDIDYGDTLVVFLEIKLVVTFDPDFDPLERALTTEAPTPCRPPET